MLPTDLEATTELDVQRLVEDAIPEKRTIEYKGASYRLSLKDAYAPAKDQDDQRAQCVELLKDISSFANSLGGHLLIGIKATKGIPIEASGVDSQNVDGLKLQISDLAARWIEPRINFNVHAVPLENGRYVIIVRVLQSLIAPHRVIYRQEPGQFYARNAAGVYSMDTSELRQAFGLSQTISEKIRTFRSNRVHSARTGGSPIRLSPEPSMMCHIVPLASFLSNLNFDAATLDAVRHKLTPMSPAVGYSPRFNLDGLCTFDNSSTSQGAYVQVFRNGVIEAAVRQIAKPHPGTNMPPEPLFSPLCIHNLIECLPRYIEAIGHLDVPGPAWIFLSFVGMEKVIVKAKDHQTGYCDRLIRLTRTSCDAVHRA